MAEDGREEKISKKGGFRTLPFILGNEICERFAMAGFNANMISYLTNQLHMPLVEASNTLTNFGGATSMTPIIGALVAESFAGRFWTITVGSIVYLLGMIILTISAILPAFRPPPCTPSGTCQRASTLAMLILYSSMLFKSIGSGGIKPNVVIFGADQLELHRSRPKWSFFNLYFFSMGLPTLLALTLVVYIQDNVGWGWGFGIPTISMFVAILISLVGYPLYIMIKPAGSPFTRLTQVVVAAFKKREVTVPADSSLLYTSKPLDADISTAGTLLRTKQFRFFDRAAVLTEGDMTVSDQPRLWRLSTVHRVEELKSIIRILPIWSVGILLVTAASHNSTFAVMQAKTMDRHLSPGLQIPASTMSIFAVVTMLLSLGVYDRVFVPVVRRFTGRPFGITYFQRIGIGLAIQILANVAAAMVEAKRKAVAAKNGLLDEKNAIVPISVFWMVPQYAIHGLADAFSSVGLMEFLYDQSPESMRSTAAALFSLASSIGSFMGTALVTLVNDYTKGSWLQDNLNRGKLNNYYWLVTLLQVFNLGCYLVCAKFYASKHLDSDAADNPSKIGGEDAVSVKPAYLEGGNVA